MKRSLCLALLATCLFAFFSCSSEDGVDDPNYLYGSSKCGEIYLGLGYDVINSSYINRGDVKIAHPILNQNKMCEDNIIVTSQMAGSQSFSYFTGSSIKEFYQERNSNISLSLGSDITSIFFSGKFGAEFSSSTSTSSVEKIFYSRVRSYRYVQDDYINGATSQNLSNYLTESFADDLKNKTAKEILDQYGTHIFIRYYKGGSLEANYTYVGTGLSTNTQVKNAVEASFSGISGGVASSNTSAKNELEENTSFKYYTYGGMALSATNINQLKEEYGSWASSISSNSDICGIPDNFSQSFISIWELASAVGETSKATQLENEFKERARVQGIALPLARNYKTADYVNVSSSKTVSLKPPTGGTIAEIEIYALGAGGGGQGGNRNGTLWVSRGTGGSGGGGSAAYLKLGNGLGLGENESVSLSVTIGSGGAGGSPNTDTFENAGCSGKNGETTTVKWSAKSITLNAPGGSGGGSGSASCGGDVVNGGAKGAKGTVNPANNGLYADGSPNFAVGEDGKKGNLDYGESPMASNGGNAAKITTGTLSSFGGGSGSIRNAGSSTRSDAQNGGGGTSGHMNESGLEGGDGLVTIVYKYYIDE